MSTSSTVSFELRNHRQSEHGPQASAQFFSTLPIPPQGIFNLFSQAPFFTFEFFNQGQTIYTFLTVPSDYAQYASSQIAAAYPEVLVRTLEHNPLVEFKHDRPKAVGQLFLQNAYYLPLKSVGKDQGDPLTSIFSSLSKLITDESAVIQIHIRKAKESWKSKGFSAISTSPGTDTQAHPNKEAISQKISQTGFQISATILSQAPNEVRAKQILTDLSQAFSGYSSNTNALICKTPLINKDKLIQKILTRTPLFKSLYVSTDELAGIAHLPYKPFSSIKNIAWGKSLLGEPPEYLPTHASTPEEEKNNINLFGKAELKNQQQIFGIKRVDRRRHMYAIGKSGTGKSTLLANLIINDLKHGEGLAVIDPHGDLIDTVLDYIPKSRINDVIVFDPSDPHAVVKMNLFEAGSVVHRELIASGIVAIFQKLYSNSWGPRLEYILRNALLTLLSTNAKLEDVLRILTDEKYRDRVVENLDDMVLKNFWQSEFNKMPDKLRAEAISPILNKVGQFVTSPLIRNVVNTNVSSFDIEEVMDQGKILLVNVSQGKLGEDNAALLGAMMITKIQLAAMNRVYKDEADRRDFYLYIDEFQNFATTSFVKILSEARKYRLNLILANQYIDQIPPEVKSAIFGNAGSLISFILGANDAAHFQQEFGNLYTQDDLVSLGRYEIITKLMIDGQVSRPFPAMTLSLASSSNQNREKVIRVSRERFSKPTT